MPASQFPLLFAVAAIAGWLDAIVGSGGLLLLPVLLTVGSSLPTPMILGTNKLIATIGKVASATVYGRRRPIEWGTALRGSLAALTGSASGAVLALSVSSAFLRPFVLILLAMTATFLLVRPKFGLLPDNAVKPHIREDRGRRLVIVIIGCGVIGFYDGLAGPGSGTFLIILFTTLLSVEFVHALSTLTVVNVSTNLGALLIFASQGQVLWVLGLGMALFSATGAMIGARMTLKRGSRFVRVVLLVVLTCTTVRLLIEQFT